MAVSVVEVTVGTDAGAVSTQTVALSATPVAGDVVVLVYASTRNTARNVSSVSGLTGASWARAAGGAGTVEYWLGTGATAAGTITVTQTGTGRGILTVYLVRGLTATTGVVSRTNAASTNALTGPAENAVTGQIAITSLASVAGTTITFPSGTPAPTTGWNANSIATDGSSNGKVGGAYRIPAAASASHRNDATSSGTMTIVTSGILILGDEVTATATMTLAGTLQAKTGAFSLFGNASLSLAADLQRKTSAVTLDAGPFVTLAGTLQQKTAAIQLETVEDTIDLALAGALQQKTSAFTAFAGADLALAGTLQTKTGSFTTFAGASLELAGTLQAKTGAFDIEGSDRTAYLAGTLRRKTSVITIVGSPILALAGTLRAKTGAFLIVKPPQTDKTNTAGGIVISGYGVHTWEPPVEDPVTAFVGPVEHDYEVALAFTVPTVTNGRPSYVVSQAQTKRHRDRILVGGKDVTYWRGSKTPTPTFRLVEPLLYGAGVLELHQFAAAFEELSAHRWLALGKTVVVQRVDVDTNEVVATDYRGFIDAHSVRGSVLTLSLGGEISGRASLMDRQPVLFRQVKDVGNWVYSAVTQSSPARFTPSMGPTTGIHLAARGGGSMYDYISELLALSAYQNGNQYTVERNTDGTWHMPIKDRTTIDATIYLDGNRMVADLHDSLAERPNRIFVTGITPEGQRVRFGGYPGLRQGEAPPYPMDDNSAFGLGTTNGDTDTGDGMTVMLTHLTTMGYLTHPDSDGSFDATVAEAVRMLQDEADLTQSGIMNLATWRALYDLSVTGYSLANSRILPAAQRTAVKRYLLSASGAIIARNPNFDPHAVIVDHSINLGAGFTRQQMRSWARAILRDALDANWAGTATCHLALVRGEHTPGVAIDASDVMPAREIKPGMNVWAPLFDGGTLFHVSGVEVPAGGRDVQLILDTRARDTMAAWECITRNRESRTNVSRQWVNNYRSSGMEKDAYGEWDEISGIISAQHLTAGWNHFPVLAGQAGTIQKIRIETDPPTEFVASLSAREISDARMTHLVPAPLTEAGTERWETPWVVNALEDRIHLESWGGYHQPCGYGTRSKYTDNDELSGAPLTGELIDPASIGYHTLNGTYVLWVAVWVPTACTIPAGRIMWNQLEGGAA